MSIRVPECDVEILATCDVLVCGGGATGVTAAVAAARHGAEVILIERWARVGGMATCALVNIWHRSDREKLVILGLAEESVQRADAGGGLTSLSGKVFLFSRKCAIMVLPAYRAPGM